MPATGPNTWPGEPPPLSTRVPVGVSAPRSRASRRARRAHRGRRPAQPQQLGQLHGGAAGGIALTCRRVVDDLPVRQVPGREQRGGLNHRGGEPTDGAGSSGPRRRHSRRAGRVAANRSPRRVPAPAGAPRGRASRGPPRGAVAGVQPAARAAGRGRRLARPLPIAVGTAAGCAAHRSRTRRETKEHQKTFHRTGVSNTLLGSLQAVDGKAVVRMEDRFSTDIDDLWSALTDPQRLARWIAEVEGDLRRASCRSRRYA